MQISNRIGDRGEIAAQLCFARAVDGHYGFEVAFIGAKAQLLDLRVALLDQTGRVFGPHFYVQVKSHGERPGRRFSCRLNAIAVRSAKAGLVPVYVVGVELVGDTTENVWICGLQQQHALPSLPKSHSLKDRNTLVRLYRDVLVHFQGAQYTFSTELA